jgi:dUTP pyrophosphatase
MKVKIVNKYNDPPVYATEGSAGLDLRAHILEDIYILGPNEIKLIPTGVYIELPKGFFAMITPRSGLAIKWGISIVNSPGIIDSDYRGEIGVILINLGKEPFTIFNGDRIAQMIITSFEKVKFEIVDNLLNTERGEGGFNSTGVK